MPTTQSRVNNRLSWTSEFFFSTFHKKLTRLKFQGINKKQCCLNLRTWFEKYKFGDTISTIYKYRECIKALAYFRNYLLLRMSFTWGGGSDRLYDTTVKP